MKKNLLLFILFNCANMSFARPYWCEKDMFSGLSSQCDTYCSSFISINKDGCHIKKDDNNLLNRIKSLLNNTYAEIRQQVAQKYLLEHGIESIDFDELTVQTKNQNINSYIESTYIDFVNNGIVSDTGYCKNNKSEPCIIITTPIGRIDGSQEISSKIKTYNSNNKDSGKCSNAITGSLHDDGESFSFNSSNRNYNSRLPSCFISDITTTINQYYESIVTEKKRLSQASQDKINKQNEEQYQQCIASYESSKQYQSYIKQKNIFINSRYQKCLQRYDSMTCYTFKLQDSIGYDLEHKKPSSNCQKNF